MRRVSTYSGTGRGLTWPWQRWCKQIRFTRQPVVDPGLRGPCTRRRQSYRLGKRLFRHLRASGRRGLPPVLHPQIQLGRQPVVDPRVGFSWPGTLALDATGVYVTGRDFPPNFSYLRKYSPEGAVLRTTKFGSSRVLQNPYALAVDRTGIYLFG